MAEAKKIKVRYEFYTFNQNATLVLEDPAEIQFKNISTIVGATIILNNSFTLNSVKDNNSGIATFPSELILKNNDNEIDVTSYTIINPAGEGVLSVVVKYFV